MTGEMYSTKGLKKMSVSKTFSFIDLFAGIGGTRLGFESAGGVCVFTSEWNKWARQTYQANFSDDHPFVGESVHSPPRKFQTMMFYLQVFLVNHSQFLVCRNVIL